jgi:hypothetical protein
MNSPREKLFLITGWKDLLRFWAHTRYHRRFHFLLYELLRFPEQRRKLRFVLWAFCAVVFWRFLNGQRMGRERVYLGWIGDQLEGSFRNEIPSTL